MQLNYYLLGFSTMGTLTVSGPYTYDNAESIGLNVFGFQKNSRHRNYLILCEYSFDQNQVAEKVDGIMVNGIVTELKHWGHFAKRSKR
jgi:hypothetical protein